MLDIWVTSDSHFNHNKEFIYAARGFQTIEEMNEAIIENWNKMIKSDDIVYHLGDVMLGADLQSGLDLVRRLNGHKYLAYGNHDTQNRLCTFVEARLFEDIKMGYRIKGPGKRSYITTHYPTITANGLESPVIGLYGHSHQSTNFFIDAAGAIRPYMYHVGVDSHNCIPVNIEDIYKEIKEVS